MNQLFAPVDEYVATFASTIGQSEAAVRMLLVYFFTFVFGLGFRIPGISRHFYSIVVGSLLLFFLWRHDSIHYYIMVIYTKLLLHFVSRKDVHWTIFFVNLTY